MKGRDCKHSINLSYPNNDAARIFNNTDNWTMPDIYSDYNKDSDFVFEVNETTLAHEEINETYEDNCKGDIDDEVI